MACSLPWYVGAHSKPFSVSKGQALTGLRVGFMVASEEMIQAIVNTFLPVNCSVSLLMQSAAKAILDNKTLYKSYQQKLQARRDKTCAALAKVPGISFPIPAGGTQFWIDVSKLGSATEVAAYLRQKGIFVGAGDSHGSYKWCRTYPDGVCLYQ